MAGSEGRDPYDDYKKINDELRQYGQKLTFKHKVIVANKMDLPEAEDNLKKFKKKYNKEILEISALQGMGIETFVKRLKDIIKEEKDQP